MTTLDEKVNNLNGQHSLGKGEVVSSILTGSTSKTNEIKPFEPSTGQPVRQLTTERNGKRAGPTVENPGTLFAVRSELDAWAARQQGEVRVAAYAVLFGLQVRPIMPRLLAADVAELARLSREAEEGEER